MRLYPLTLITATHFSLAYLSINSIACKKFQTRQLELFFNCKVRPHHACFCDLHWLPIKFRVQLKLILIVYKSLQNQAPPYINDLLSMKTEFNYSLRSSSKLLLSVPGVNCSTLGDRALTRAASFLWNSLPLTTRSSSSSFIKRKKHSWRHL